jgi:hypothetical protein
MRNAFQIIFLAALALVTQGTSSLPEKLIIGYANWGECDWQMQELFVLSSSARNLTRQK